MLASVVIIAGWYWWRSRRHQELVGRYGPEYKRVVRDVGDPQRADRELEAREKRVSGFELRELSPEQRERYPGGLGVHPAAVRR